MVVTWTKLDQLGLIKCNSLHLIFIVGSVSSSTATTLLGSPVVASVVVAVVAVVVVVSEASLPSLSQLTPEARGQYLLSLTHNNSSYPLKLLLLFGLLFGLDGLGLLSPFL